MTERLLQFIWQFQYFSKSEMRTVGGDLILILDPGQYNRNQGPDFYNAKIRIDSTVWAGTIELHLKTSDWERHHHQIDKNYQSVILHVVWENDGIKNNIPVLELREKVSKILLERYDELLRSPVFIPCEDSIHKIPDITWSTWKDRLVAERLIRKSKMVVNYLRQSNYHWEETFWWLLARNFGIKVNADAFEELARSIPVTVLARHKNHVHQLEALLLGQAGLLNLIPANIKQEEDYPQILQEEYRFHRAKYKLRDIHIQPLFLRMRPGNFPTIRLAQLAMLVHVSAHLFSILKESATINDIRKLFSITASHYWDDHYRLYERSWVKKKKLGNAMIDNIIINSVVPVTFAYGQYHNETKYQDKSSDWLQKTPAENNSITLGFRRLGVENKDAHDSQALIELKNEYCDKKRCLDCPVGNHILQKG